MRRGITLLEVLVVLVLAVVATGVAIVLIARQRENGQRAQCMNNLRVIGNAVHAYHTASSADKDARMLPPSRIADGYATWAVLLAPHVIDQHPLQQWDLQQSYFAQSDEVRQARLLVYFCPSRARSITLSESGDVDANDKHFPGGLGDYASVAGDGSENHDWTGPKANGALVIADVLERTDERIRKWRSRTSLNSLTRGESYTFLIGEKHVPWGRMGEAEVGDGSVYNGQVAASFSRIAGVGYPLAESPSAPFNKNFGSYHNGICQFLLADTSVRPMAIGTSEQVLARMSRRGD